MEKFLPWTKFLKSQPYSPFAQNILQRADFREILRIFVHRRQLLRFVRFGINAHCNTPQHTATHCNALHHTASCRSSHGGTYRRILGSQLLYIGHILGSQLLPNAFLDPTSHGGTYRRQQRLRFVHFSGRKSHAGKSHSRNHHKSAHHQIYCSKIVTFEKCYLLSTTPALHAVRR